MMVEKRGRVVDMRFLYKIKEELNVGKCETEQERERDAQVK